MGRFLLDVANLGSARCFVEEQCQLVKNRRERYRLNPKKKHNEKIQS